MYILIYILFAMAVLYLLAVWPGKGRQERMEIFSRQLIAHRGLHDGESAPENTLEAFRRAAEGGYGIELDIRETADGVLVVSHDDSLLRTAGIDRKISTMTRRELQNITLGKSSEHVPLFSEVLELVGGRVPLIVEIKSEDRKGVPDLCENAAFHLDSYEGPYCVESFNPLVVRWFKKNRPMTLRGQLAERFKPGDLPNPLISGFFSVCMLNFLARPDFIAYNVQHRNLLRYRLLHDLFHVFGVGWTVKSEEELRAVSSDFEAYIFDSFSPTRGSVTGTRPEGTISRKERNMKDIIRVHMLISGTVTGVGFRYRATRIAQTMGVTGWVRNTSDDLRVEMELQGTRAEIDEVIERLRHERYIHITEIEETPLPAIESEYEFKVRY